MSAIEKIIDDIIKREGGYVYHKDDRGGATNGGITEAVARHYGYTGDMKALPMDLIREIYRKRYFYEPGFDKVEKLSLLIADKMTDIGVNMGQSRAVMFLQRSLNLFNRDNIDYPILTVDGNLGPMTLRALDAFLQKRKNEKGEIVLRRALNNRQGDKYFDIAEKDKSQKAFTYGWFAHRID